LANLLIDSCRISRRAFLQSFLAGGLFGGLTPSKPAFGQDPSKEATEVSENKARGTRMDDDRPSATALAAAFLRAAHQILDQPRILDDPLAVRILGSENESALRSNPERYDTRRSLRSLIVLRSRYAEDELARAVQQGVRQYVILGAGLDTFPYRNPYPASRLRVYEVDHPATQSWKRRQLQQAKIAIPDSLAYAPVDFEKQTLGDGLGSVGFKKEEPAFFSMLGVVIYLTKSAIMETLRFVASLSSGSEIVFDYSVSPSRLPEGLRSAHESAANRVAALGEPWITYWDPSALAVELRQIGFREVEDIGPQEANQRYFKDRSDGLQLRGSSHLIKARVY
jgi:methyltransferase (TIGR00027 family)